MELINTVTNSHSILPTLCQCCIVATVSQKLPPRSRVLLEKLIVAQVAKKLRH